MSNHDLFNSLDAGGSHPIHTVVETADYERLRLFQVNTACSVFPRERDGLEEMRFRWRHDTITDFEHDRAVMAELVLLNPRLGEVWEGAAVITGIVNEIHYYATGESPLMDTDGDGAAVPCSYDRCGVTHMIGRYFPPKRAELKRAFIGRPVRVRFYPSLAPERQDNE